MKQENLDELRNIYLGLVTGGEGPEVLNEDYLEEAPVTGNTFVDRILQGGQAFFQGKPRPSGVVTPEIRAAQQKADWKREALLKSTPGYDQTKGTTLRNNKPTVLAQRVSDDGVMEPGKPETWKKKDISSDEFDRYRQVRGDDQMQKDAMATVAARIRQETRRREEKPPVPGTQPAGSPPSRPPAGSSSTPPPRPAAASGPVLSKKDGVEGTGVGANFNKKAFTDTERTRYSSVAAQNAARTPAASAVSPTKPVAPVGDKFGTTSTIKPPSPTQVKSDTPTTQLTKMQPSSSDNSGETDRLKKALDIKKSDVTSSYQFPMYKTLRDLSDSYNEIYEAKKKLDPVGQEDDDIDNDGDTDKSDKYLLNRRKVRSKAIGEATAMSKRGLDEPAIRNQIASKTGGGSFADKATKLADRETYGDKKKKEGRENLARKQRGDFRDTTSSNPGLHGYAYKATTDADKEKKAARGAQRGRLTPNERKQLNMEYDLYDLIQSHLLEYGFADTEEGANMIIENMSPSWIKQILSED